MLIEFDQNTIANMTAALEHVCKRIPQGRDSHEVRKRIADAMVACGQQGRRSLLDFRQAGLKVLEEIINPQSFSWLLLWRSKGTE